MSYLGVVRVCHEGDVDLIPLLHIIQVIDEEGEDEQHGGEADHTAREVALHRGDERGVRLQVWWHEWTGDGGAEGRDEGRWVSCDCEVVVRERVIDLRFWEDRLWVLREAGFKEEERTSEPRSCRGRSRNAKEEIPSKDEEIPSKDEERPSKDEERPTSSEVEPTSPSLILRTPLG